MIAAKRFKYRGKWIAEGDAVDMPADDERAHRLTGLVVDAPEVPEPKAEPAKRQRKKK